MSNVQGKISSSLDVALADVTMSLKATPLFYSASLIVYDIAAPYNTTITLPPTQENDVVIITTLVGGATATITVPEFTSIAKVSGSALNAEWFWKRLTASQATQDISSRATNFYGAATVWRGCVTESTPYLEPVVALGQTLSTTPIAASVTASEDHTLLVAFANIEDDRAFSSFPPSGWTDVLNVISTQGTACSLYAMTKNEIPVSGSATEQVEIGTMSNYYWGSLTLLLKSSDTSSVYTTYTDADGIYSQSLASGWTGKLSPTNSGYEFFSGPSVTKNSVGFIISSSDITEDFIAVKDFSSGIGVYTDPYIISDHEDMHNVRYRTGSNTGGGFISYKLGSDIDLSPIAEWQTINPSAGTPLNCTFDGNNKTISNLTMSVVDDSQNAYGLFGAFRHSSSYACGDVTLNSCSINLENGFSTTTNRYYGMFAAYNWGTPAFKNIHIQNSIVRHNRTSDSGNCLSHMGAIIGIIGSSDITSCSIENTTVHLNIQGPTTTNSNYIGGLVGKSFNGDCTFTYSYVKSSSVFANRNNFDNYFGLLSGGYNIYAYDCYVLNSVISGSGDVPGFLYSSHVSSQRNYVAGINYGNTAIGDKYPFQSQTTPVPAGFCYWESGSNIFTNTASLSGISSASVDQIKSIRFLKADGGFDFDNVWARNDQFQNGYPFFYWEEPTITSASISGILTSSLGVVVENVTMSFFNSGTKDINRKI